MAAITPERGGVAACQGKLDTAPKQTAQAHFFMNSFDVIKEEKNQHVKPEKYPLLTLINSLFPWAGSLHFACLLCPHKAMPAAMTMGDTDKKCPYIDLNKHSSHRGLAFTDLE